MKLDIEECFTVTGFPSPFGTLGAAMAAIDKSSKPGTYTIAHSYKVVATGAGVAPGAAAVGKPASAPPK